ncbi:FecR family protein [Agrobacterium tumefaciens]|uniref:FecR family protein n=1 Tax=Agrobacterium tumefaciens TaxID=358 RepID=UPI00287F186A|nr:FecR family protein [Agrobacterium tumefaciens]MDS7594729.1 FecR family protein [Agrobacterium tumefaciens]
MTIDPDKKIEIPPGKLEEAADWLIQLEDGSRDPECRQRLDNWLGASVANRLAWERTLRTWKTLGLTDPAFGDQWMDAPRFPLKTERKALRRHWPSKRAFGGISLAAVSLCLAIISFPSLLIQARADHTTGTAENRSVTLEDGSLIQLAASSAISGQFSAGQRKIRLLEGEAFFDVVPDPGRPFVVEANGVSVEVIGTAFDVDVTGNTIQVALARGSVKASLENAPPTTLVPGEMLVVDTVSGEVRKSAVSVEDIGGWRNGELYVVDATIGQVVEQIQRYHPAWITLADSTLSQQRVTGFYDLHDPDRALAALVEPYGGKVRGVSGLARVVSRY